MTRAQYTPGAWEVIDHAEMILNDTWIGVGPYFTAEDEHGEGHDVVAYCHPDNAPIIAAAVELLEALDYLLEQTVDQDMKYGIALSEGEQDAREKALAVIAKVRGVAI